MNGKDQVAVVDVKPAFYYCLENQNSSVLNFVEHAISMDNDFHSDFLLWHTLMKPIPHDLLLSQEKSKKTYFS